jgi:hypothetical protein
VCNFYNASIFQEYLNSDPADRDQETPIYRIRQGCEPPTFTGFFGVWDDDFFKVSFSFVSLLCSLDNKVYNIVRVSQLVLALCYRVALTLISLRPFCTQVLSSMLLGK